MFRYKLKMLEIANFVFGSFDNSTLYSANEKRIKFLNSVKNFTKRNIFINYYDANFYESIDFGPNPILSVTVTVGA